MHRKRQSRTSPTVDHPRWHEAANAGYCQAAGHDRRSGSVCRSPISHTCQRGARFPDVYAPSVFRTARITSWTSSSVSFADKGKLTVCSPMLTLFG
jgi:hypothetical protein